MTHPFLDKLRNSWDPTDWRDVTVIVGVSGGADSVALASGLAMLRRHGTGNQHIAGKLIAAHFNHCLRAEASQADESFTRSLCEQLGLTLEVGTSTIPLSGDGETSEAVARTHRYTFFGDLAKAKGARFVVTAHTADDQAETVLHRIIRGTGLSGLSGIPRTRPLDRGITMLRPLLTITRHEVLDYLESISQPFCEDASNRDPRYTRNRIRAELLPDLARNYNPQVRPALLRLGSLAADTQQVTDALCADILSRCATVQGVDQVRIRFQPLVPFPVAVRRELVKRMWKQLSWPEQAMDFEHWNHLAEMLDSASGPAKVMFPGNVVAVRHAHDLQLTRQA